MEFNEYNFVWFFRDRAREEGRGEIKKIITLNDGNMIHFIPNPITKMRISRATQNIEH